MLPQCHQAHQMPCHDAISRRTWTTCSYRGDELATSRVIADNAHPLPLTSPLRLYHSHGSSLLFREYVVSTTQAVPSVLGCSYINVRK